jgi:hypothetical protein
VESFRHSSRQQQQLGKLRSRSQQQLGKLRSNRHQEMTAVAAVTGMGIPQQWNHPAQMAQQ